MKIDFSVCSSVDQQAQKRERERGGGGGGGGGREQESRNGRLQAPNHNKRLQSMKPLNSLSCMLRWNAWTLHCGRSCIEASTPFVVYTDQQRQFNTIDYDW